jgi:hypothetical protein
MAYTAAGHRQAATDLLVNYFQAIAHKAGMQWDPDYTAEIALAVEHIAHAAAMEVADALKASRP